jgi:hypothetical protein
MADEDVDSSGEGARKRHKDKKGKKRKGGKKDKKGEKGKKSEKGEKGKKSEKAEKGKKNKKGGKGKADKNSGAGIVKQNGKKELEELGEMEEITPENAGGAVADSSWMTGNEQVEWGEAGPGEVGGDVLISINQSDVDGAGRGASGGFDGWAVENGSNAFADDEQGEADERLFAIEMPSKAKGGKNGRKSVIDRAKRQKDKSRQSTKSNKSRVVSSLRSARGGGGHGISNRAESEENGIEWDDVDGVRIDIDAPLASSRSERGGKAGRSGRFSAM